MKADGPWVTKTLNELEDQIRELDSENKRLAAVNKELKARLSEPVTVTTIDGTQLIVSRYTEEK